MARTMRVADFKQMLMDMAQTRVSFEAYFDFLQYKTQRDKYLREEYLPILAMIKYKAIPDAEQIELGEETEPWDARIGGKNLYEVV
jgi:hypothetical protein